MCLSCGCGRPHDDHGDHRHITVEAVEAAGKAAGIPAGEAASNVASGYREMTDVVEKRGDAWMHEMRGRHGEWVHTGEGVTVAGADVLPPRQSHGYQGRFTGRDTFIPSMRPAEGVKDLSSKGRPDGAGTADDPIDVQGNIDRAILLMAQGKHVRLNQPDEIVIMLDKVNKLADEYEKRGRKMPQWDFGKITVAGTNLFAAQTKGIPRVKMPQLNGPAQPGTRAAELAGGAGKFIELDKQFREQLARDGVQVTDEMVPTAHLRATQMELRAPA